MKKGTSHLKPKTPLAFTRSRAEIDGRSVVDVLLLYSLRGTHGEEACMISHVSWPHLHPRNSVRRKVSFHACVLMYINQFACRFNRSEQGGLPSLGKRGETMRANDVLYRIYILFKTLLEYYMYFWYHKLHITKMVREPERIHHGLSWIKSGSFQDVQQHILGRKRRLRKSSWFFRNTPIFISSPSHLILNLVKTKKDLQIDTPFLWISMI
jgi:hypothetical protein